MDIPAVRLTVHALDVVLSVRRRHHLIYMNFISPQRAAKQSNTVKYTKYTFAYCQPPIADMLLMGGAIRQHCTSVHITAISYVYSTRICSIGNICNKSTNNIIISKSLSFFLLTEQQRITNANIAKNVYYGRAPSPDSTQVGKGTPPPHAPSPSAPKARRSSRIRHCDQ